MQDEKTTVVNKFKEPYDIYIGRPSKWGNPFIIGKDGDREEVIEKYKIWLVYKSNLLSEIGELKRKKLGCFCKPEACHGDVLAAFANGENVDMIISPPIPLDKLEGMDFV